MHWILISSSTISHSSTPLPSEAGCYSSNCGSAPGSGLFPTLGHSRGQHPVEDACASQNLIEIWQLHYLKLRKIKIMLKLGFSYTTWDFQEENDLVTYFYSASEFIGLIHITSLAKASSSSVRPDLPSLGGWILILDRLVWMSPALLMCHKSATVWCHPGLFPSPPFLSQHTVWFLYPLSWRCGKGRKMRALTSGSQARQFIWGE